MPKRESGRKQPGWVVKSILPLCCCAALLLAMGCAPATSDTARTRKKTVITVLHGQSTTDPGLEDMLSAKITEVFPDVELEWESFDWGDYFSSEMRAKIAAGEVPDLIIGKAQDVSGYYASGFLGAFDDCFAGYIRAEALGSVTVEGALYGIPYNALYQGVLYNKNIFRRFSIQPPQSLEELRRVVDRLNQVGVTPFAAHFKENWYTANVLMQCAVNEVFRATPDWGAQLRAGAVDFSTSEAFGHCFAQTGYILQNSWPDALSVLQNECDKRFADEEAAMYVTGTWTVQTLAAIRPQMQVGFFPYPNTAGDAELLFEPNITFMKNANSEHEALVEEIILSLVEDNHLAESIAQFTQTESLLMGVQANSLTMIQEDIERSRRSGAVVDVSLGNSQLVWRFQEELARETRRWLEGEITLEDVLLYADYHRSDSGGY